MRIIGLTGGIACGKSTVSRHLAEHGLAVVDADALARDATKKGAWAYRRVLRAFPNQQTSIVDPTTGELDREAVARLAFADPQARRRLNQATHLPVALALAGVLLRHWLLLRPLVIVDMPLLFETGFDRVCSATVVVTAPEDVQVARLKQRDGMEERDASRRIAAQMASAERERRATAVLRNGGECTREELRAQVDALVCDRTKQRLFRRRWGWAVLTWPPTAWVLAMAAAAWFGRRR
jgi:dephospho-CoA kinase